MDSFRLYIRMNQTLREMSHKAVDGHDYASDHRFDGTAEALVLDYLRADLKGLGQLWPDGVSKTALERASKLVADTHTGPETYRELAQLITRELGPLLDDYFEQYLTGVATVS